jgi:hypothetical protein
MKNNNDENTAQELWSNGVAAKYLSGQLPERNADQWELWLRNNRNQSRKVPYRIELERISNGTFYTPEDLAKFVEWEKSRQLGTIKLTKRSAEVMRAFGIGNSNGSATGRKFELIGISKQYDPATNESFVRMITGEPLMIYRLTLDQALLIGKGLIEAVKD